MTDHSISSFLFPLVSSLERGISPSIMGLTREWGKKKSTTPVSGTRVHHRETWERHSNSPFHFLFFHDIWQRCEPFHPFIHPFPLSPSDVKDHLKGYSFLSVLMKWKRRRERWDDDDDTASCVIISFLWSLSLCFPLFLSLFHLLCLFPSILFRPSVSHPSYHVYESAIFEEIPWERKLPLDRS